jgi:xyloglucan-specific exo-beta-1,4-glucanase
MKTHNILLSFFLMTALTISAQSFQQYNYKLVPFGGGGCVTGVITCPTQKDLIYARTDVGGIWRWLETTQSWKNLSFKFPKPGMLSVESVAIDPQNPNKVYAVVGESYFDGGATFVLRSSDYGENWEFIDISSKFKALGNTGGQKACGERLIVDPNLSSTLYFGSRATGLWKSIDSGTSWNKVTTFPMSTNTKGNGILFVDFLAEYSSKGEATMAIFAGISRTDKVAPLDSANVYLSIDYGNTWLPISKLKGNGTVTPPANYTPQHHVYAGGKIYVTYGDAPRSCVWRYDPVSEIWEDVSPNDNAPISGISVDNTTNPSWIALTTNTLFWGQGWISGITSWGDDIYRGKISSTGAITWDKRMIANGLAKYDMSAKFINGEMHWAWDIKIDPFNPNRVFVTAGTGIFSTKNFTSPVSLWYHNVEGLEETVTMDVTSKPGGELLYAIGDASGATYSDPTKYGIRFNPLQAITSSVDYVPTASTLYRAGSERVANGITSSLMYSNDGGKVWTGVPVDKIPFSPAMPATITSADVKATYGRIAVSADGKILAWSPRYWQVNNVKYYGNFYTANNGATWVEFPGEIKEASVIYADKVNPKVFYICTGSMIYVYTWTGTGFTHQTYNTPATLSKILAINPLVEGEFLAFSSSGLYYYTSKGQQYTKIANINSCNGVSWGKPAPGKTNPTVFVFGKYGLESVSRVYRSDDGMKTWVRVSDDNSLFGGVLTKNIICGDMNTYGRVYVSNSGIGLVYGDIDTQSAVNEVGFRKSNELAKLSANPFRFSTGIRSENKLQFSIFALNGKMVETGNIQGNTEIGIQLNSGIYILKLIDVSNKAQQVIKLLKM